MKKKSGKAGVPDEGAREIRAFMAEHGLDDLVIECGKEKIEVRSGTPSFYAPMSPKPLDPPAPAAAPASPYVQIRSPMAGTFYRAASPASGPYVNEGDPVSPGMTVCVIEAMKVMNEIKAEVSGKIVKICVENAASIESGTALFEVDPAGSSG